ncbi:Neutral ceramidase [Globisporangium polare]
MKTRAVLSFILALFFTCCLQSAIDAAYRVGVGKGDITGPAAEVVMMGYADSSQKSAGILNRLYARAFIVEDVDTAQRIVFVNCDLQAVFQLVHQDVIQQLGVKYNGLYTEQNVVLHATHTHAGPGGSSAYFLYDVTILGFINENFEVIVSGILKAIEDAHNSVAPGTIRFSKGTIVNGGKNRSPLAYAANPEDERKQYEFNHDTDLRLLQFRDATASNTLRGVLGFFPVHPTSLTQKNHLVSGDNKGYAEFLLEEKYPGLIAGVGISNAADVSPNLVDNGNGTFRGEGATDVESAEIIGKRQADKVMELLSSSSSSELVNGSVLSRLAYVDFSNVKLKDRVATSEDPYADRTCPAVVGQNFGAGTEDGRGLAAFTEGELTANPLFKAIGAAIKDAPEWVETCQSKNKVPLLATGLMSPVPWTPEILPVQVVKIGQFALAVTNFEVSTMAGRRIRTSVHNALQGAGVTEVEIASISNAYAQYLTTKEEYLTQNYEGASTLFGPNQLAAVQQELVRVAGAVADPSFPLDIGQLPRQFDRSKLVTVQTGVVMDTVPLGKKFGALRSDVQTSSYAIGDTVSASFYGGHPKNNLSAVSSFCDVEQETLNGKFVTLLTDSHWDVRFKWTRNGISESNSVCEWRIRNGGRGSVAGRYRIRHRGFSKAFIGAISYYEGVSSAFEVK